MSKHEHKWREDEVLYCQVEGCYAYFSIEELKRYKKVVEEAMEMLCAMDAVAPGMELFEKLSALKDNVKELEEGAENE